MAKQFRALGGLRDDLLMSWESVGVPQISSIFDLKKVQAPMNRKILWIDQRVKIDHIHDPFFVTILNPALYSDPQTHISCGLF